MMLGFLQVLVLLVMGVMGLAFVTLVERKILSLVQWREGPNKVGGGYLQPFSDALKLVSKGWVVLGEGDLGGYVMGAWLFIFLMMLLWGMYPTFWGVYSLEWTLLCFILVLSVSVYGLLVSGWMSNSKYGLLGGVRSVAQTVSYEVSLVLVVMYWVLYMGGYGLEVTMEGVWLVFLNILMFVIMGVVCISELNRSPFDFSEGESELVSGYNVEYGSLLFVYIFMSEYGFVVFWSGLLGWMFMGGLGGLIGGLKVMLLSWGVLWWRGVLPRFRYDKLMFLSWGVLLYCSLWGYVMAVGCMLVVWWMS
uniref:NADH-ubiquinone oxidoreductase chain 1 n=1 Tax=Armillifer armillatus TaxID=260804 RepID=Q6SL32_ARMAR|nr:NADH dehydrogenase subunit 1 [Armillifer armillatus]